MSSLVRRGKQFWANYQFLVLLTLSKSHVPIEKFLAPNSSSSYCVNRLVESVYPPFVKKEIDGYQTRTLIASTFP